MHQRIGSAASHFNVRGDLGTQVNREGSARADVIVAQSPLNVVCSGWAVYPLTRALMLLRAYRLI